MNNIKLHGGVYTTEKMDVIRKDLSDLKRGGSIQTLCISQGQVQEPGLGQSQISVQAG